MNELFLTIVRRPLQGKVGIADRLSSWFSRSTQRNAALIAAEKHALDNARDALVAALGQYTPHVLSAYDTPEGLRSEPLEFLSCLCNADMRPVTMPHGDLGHHIPVRRISFGQDTVELAPTGHLPRRFQALISIKDYPGQTMPGMFDELYRLPFEMSVSQSFAFVERGAALGRMNLALRRMRSAEIADMETGYYLDSFLAPLSPWLTREDVTDIYINRAQEVWIETLGGSIERHDEPALEEKLLARLARQIAASSSQGISRTQPLLAARLPDGSRCQIVAPPATRGGHVFAIRRHVSASFSLQDWTDSNAFADMVPGGQIDDTAPDYREVGSDDAPQCLAEAVRGRKNILIAGGTSTGKTTFLNSLLAEIPANERLLLIEDTEELQVRHANMIGLLAARSELSEANVDAEDLLIAALRMRPDRIILGELRGREAFTFLRAVNTGHPGSMTTIHADSPQRAIDQLALLVLQSGARLGWDDIRRYVATSVDVFVQLTRSQGKRGVSQILVKR